MFSAEPRLVVVSDEMDGMNDLTSCHFCDAEISSTAKKCRYCGEWVSGQCKQCGVNVRGRWAEQSLCANCEQVAPAADPPVVHHVVASGGMTQKQLMRSCLRCGTQTMHIQQRPNHILHLLLSVFTVGFWIPVWVLVGLFQDKPQCTICGKKPGLFGLW